jgi:hypothetical protein
MFYGKLRMCAFEETALRTTRHNYSKVSKKDFSNLTHSFWIVNVKKATNIIASVTRQKAAVSHKKIPI